MRELKFRAWDVFNTEMFPKKVDDDLLVKFFRDVNRRRNGGNCVYVMQYTGLKDKDGAEIYEGDIVYARMSSKYYVVSHGLYDHLVIDDKPSPNCYGWYITSDTKPRYNEYFDGESLEGAEEFLAVVGNIYETPNLLNAEVE